jgi:hypothetical protein
VCLAERPTFDPGAGFRAAAHVARGKAGCTMVVKPYHWYIVGGITFIAWTVFVFFALETMVLLTQTR